MALPRPTLSLKGHALKYLSQREHSRAELARKLAPHTEEASLIEPLLDELTERGFLSDRRYAASVVHRRGERFGAARIRQELLSKGTPAAEVTEVVAALRETELSRASALWQRRFGSAPADSREAARQGRFLIARGFSAEVVRQVLRRAGQPDDDVPDLD
ncbi:MAG: recombination regulator RecX [Leptothrix sp. (in: b-proteobacteria)]